MSRSSDLQVSVLTTPRRILNDNVNRFSWSLFVPGATTIYYMRGERGANVSTSGNNQGIPIIQNNHDGWDETDAHEEVWVVAVSETVALLSVTNK